MSTEAAIFERKQREKKQAAAEADPQLAAEQRKKEEDREEKRQAATNEIERHISVAPLLLDPEEMANHSLIMASHISRANAAIIDLRTLLAQG